MTRDADALAAAADRLRRSRRVVLLTGAGISAASGIPTFRDEEGIWRRFGDLMESTWPSLASLAIDDPCRVIDFILAFADPIAAAQPNPAHRAIAHLARHVEVTVATQNIDGLHQAAGSRRVFELHGSIFESRYQDDGSLRSRLTTAQLATLAARLKAIRRRPDPAARLLAAIRPAAGIDGRGIYHPSVVLFGELLPEEAWAGAISAAGDCDCMIVAGTSGNVHPAAQLPGEALDRGAELIWISPEAALDSPAKALALTAAAEEALPRLLAAAFG